MKKVIIIIVASVFITSTLSGQIKDSIQKFPDFQTRELQGLRQLWNKTENSAGMGFSNVNTGSLTSINKYFSNGDHHRVQEGSANNGLTFSTERYDKFSEKVYVRGSFAFNMNF